MPTGVSATRYPLTQRDAAKVFAGYAKGHSCVPGRRSEFRAKRWVRIRGRIAPAEKVTLDRSTVSRRESLSFPYVLDDLDGHRAPRLRRKRSLELSAVGDDHGLGRLPRR